MKKILLVLTLTLLGATFNMSAQKRQVSGKVISEEGHPLLGVTVVVRGTSTGTTTDINGEFLLNAPQNSTLRFSFVGMVTTEVQIGTNTSIDIVMKSSAEEIENVLVVAYGTAKKESFTGSAEVIKPSEIVKRNVANISKALEGSVAGIIATSGGGQPGAGVDIRIRGTGSMNASNDPLYVVDGMPYDGAISAINANDVESITVLKDASASALFGARGANGVIMITTKKGKAGEVKVNFKADWGFSKRGIKNYETPSIPEYMEFFRSIRGKDFMSSLGGENYNPYNLKSTELFDENGKIKKDAKLRWNENWLDMAEQTAFRHEYQLGVTGGNEKAQYYISLGYLDEEGVAKTTEFDRYSASARVDVKATEWMKMGVSLMASRTKSNYLYDLGGAAYTNIWYAGLNLAPIYPVYQKDADGKTVFDENGRKVFDYGKDRPALDNSNAIGALYNDPKEDVRDNLSARTYLTFATKKDITFIKDLSATLSFGMDYYNRNLNSVYNSKYGQYSEQGGLLSKTNHRNTSYTFNQLITYKKSIERHNIDLLLGHEYYDMTYNRLRGSKTGFAGLPGNIEFPAYASIDDLGSRKDVYRIESYLSRLNYDFDGRYYFSASFRRDGTSRFKDNRWGNFWSLGASWRISQEEFMKDVYWLNNLTFKISYGEQGNDNLSQEVSNVWDYRYYAYQNEMDLAYTNANYPGAILTRIENKELKWEKNKNLNIGIETSMFKNRLSVTAEFYVKNTSDLLMNRPMPPSLGVSYFLDNVGAMRNTGFDLTISGAPVVIKDFRWDVTFIASHWKNKITKLYGGLKEMAPTNLFINKVGQPLNSFYPVLAAGVDPENGTQLYKYYGEDKDGKMGWITTGNWNTALANRSDKNLKGSRVPDLLGSITNNFQYKGFDMSFMFTYSIGGKVFDGNYFNLFGLRSRGMNVHKDVINKSWKKPGDKTNIPKPSPGATVYVTDYYLTNASYLCFKNISLGYTFRQDALKKVGISSLRVSVTGNNMYTWSHRKGMDPQNDFSGRVNYSYVPIKNISFGLDVNF